ncbi:MAG: hypothetical protein WCK42_04365 [Myxococcaceae bacterium]
MQYTIRQVPSSLDHQLRHLAQINKRSLNRILLDLITHAVEGSKKPTLHHDLDRFIASWVHDPETEEALIGQRQIVPGDWQ